MQGMRKATRLTEIAASEGAPSALQTSAVSHRFSTASSGLWVCSSSTVLERRNWHGQLYGAVTCATIGIANDGSIISVRGM